MARQPASNRKAAVDLASPDRPPTEFAPAKVNLYLHLVGRRADGYHFLDSLVVFPAVGDRVTVDDRPGRGLSLDVGGRFGGELCATPDNLVLRAAQTLATANGLVPNAGIRLEKHLPVASGIGGGSSDAAATLRLLSRLWDVPVPAGLALSLGADVPVCLTAPIPLLMAGIGDQLSPSPHMPGFWVVLANPAVAAGTAAVFAAVEQRDLPPGPPPPSAGFNNFSQLVDWLACQRNDLQAAAVSICPVIAEVLLALSRAPIARMSGSGATCFALHASEATAVEQAASLGCTHPDWWVAAAPVAATPAR